MNKKILALALAIVFIATAFTACKKGPELTKLNGQEYPLAEDKNGETIINDENQVAVLVTDRSGEVLTHSDGENQTHWVQINGALVIDDILQEKNYTLAIPEGWTGNESTGRVEKDGTDNKCYIKFVKITELEAKESLDTYLEKIDAQNTAISEAFEDEEQMDKVIKQNPQLESFKGSKYEITERTETLPAGNYNCQVRVHKITDKNGDVVHYAENYYFVADKTIYQVAYVCEEGKGYDDGSFSFSNYLSDGFTFKPEKK